jgi:hypothetical protein
MEKGRESTQRKLLREEKSLLKEEIVTKTAIEKKEIKRDAIFEDVCEDEEEIPVKRVVFWKNQVTIAPPPKK